MDDDEFDEEEKQFSIEWDLEAIIRRIRCWDGEDVTHILPLLEEYEELKFTSQYYHLGVDFGEIGPTEEDTVFCALKEAPGGWDDFPDWPPPWNEECCTFAYVSDKNGQFLTREFQTAGKWQVDRWEAGANCRFDENSE